MKLLKHVLAIMALALVLVGTAQAEEAVWIDVRSQAEYDADHMKDTTLIPHTEIREQIGKLNLTKDTPIKLFCRSGNRAGVAKAALEEMGYSNVENVGSIGDARKLRD